MKKINNNGFVLAETLIVTVFVMTIFTLLYVNFFPLLGEYAKREFYDDIDSKYDAYWIKRMIQNPTFFPDFDQKIIDKGTKPYVEITCNDFAPEFQNVCKQYINQIVATDPADENDTTNTKKEEDKNKLITILLTDYAIGNKNSNSTSYLKNYMANEDKKDSSEFSPNFLEYISYLPDYNLNPSKNNANYRIIIEFRRKIDIKAGSDPDNLYYTYSTIEVLRDF